MWQGSELYARWGRGWVSEEARALDVLELRL